MQKKISVVTGANGYLGYTLVNALAARGEEVRPAMRRNLDCFDALGLKPVIGELDDEAYLEKAFAGAETVYHVAGVVDITGKRDEMVWKVNFEGTKHVVAACKKCGVKTMVYVSSVDCIPVSETWRPLPNRTCSTRI